MLESGTTEAVALAKEQSGASLLGFFSLLKGLLSNRDDCSSVGQAGRQCSVQFLAFPIKGYTNSPALQGAFGAGKAVEQWQKVPGVFLYESYLYPTILGSGQPPAHGHVQHLIIHQSTCDVRPAEKGRDVKAVSRVA